MAKKYLRTCEVCLRRFRARADARTCSPACRKSLQRAARRVIREAESVAENLAQEAYVAGEKIEAAAEKAEAVLIPVLDDEAGFIEVHQPGQLISPGSVIPGLPQTSAQQVMPAAAESVDTSSVLTESENLDPEDELEFTDSSKTSKGVLKLMSGVLAVLLILAGLLALLDFSGLLPSNYSQKITVNKLGNTIQNVTNQVSSLNKQVVTLRGAAGANGANGSNGAKGTSGTQGPAGPQGPAGSDGADGATGPEGPAGPQGPAGSASCTNGNCVSLQAASPGVQESGNISITGNMNVGGLYLVNGNQLAVSNLADSGNIARLNGTGPQTFTGNNKFTGTLLQKNVFNTAAAFQVQNAAGAGILTVDTVNDRVAINQNSANYTLDVNGDINTTSLYRVNGVQISTSNLSDGLNIARLNVNQTFSGINTFSNASNSFTGNGAGLTQLNASNLATGTVNDARLPNTLVKVDQNNTFTGQNIFQYHPPLGQNGLQSFEIQNPGGGNLLVADTDNMRIAINQTSANYTLDVNGTINGTNLLQNGNDVCDVSGNCAGVGGQIGGSGTPGTIAMFTTGSATIGDSIITQNSGTIAIAGNINLTGLNPKYEINGSQISSSNLSDSSNIARLNANQTFTGNNTIKPILTGSTTQFQVQTPGGSDVLQVDTANSLVALGQAGALSGQIVFNNSSNSNTVTIQPGVTGSSYTLQLPTSGPTTDNCLQTDSVTATQLVFGNCSGPGSGVDTIGTLDSQPKTADGATIISKDLFLQTADATHPGLVSTGTQTFAGDKTLTGNTTLTGTTLSKPTTDSTAGFQVQNSTGSTILTADTVNRFVGIGTAGPQATLDVETNSTDFFDGFESGILSPFTSNGGWSVTSAAPHTGSLAAVGTAAQGVNQTMSLSRTLTAAGSITVWIRQAGIACNLGDGGNFKVDSTTIVSWGRCLSAGSYTKYTAAVGVGTHSFTWTINGGTLDVDDVTVTNAGVGTAAIFNGGNVGIGTSFPSASLEVDGTTLLKPAGVDSSTLFQVQNAEGGPLLNADSLNSVVTVGQGNLIVSGLGTPSAPVVTNSSNQGGSLSGDPAVTYYYKITAVNTAGNETLASSEASFSAAGFTPISAPTAPTLTAVAGTDLGVGTYLYKVTFVTANGETTGGTTATVTTTAGNQDVNVTNIPTGAAGTIARNIYRTVAGGADGSQQLLTTINDNSTTSFLDNIPDGSLGAGLPASNTATTNNNETSISFATIPGAASYRIYRGTSPGAENSYQTTSAIPFIDTGAAGTAASTPTSSGVEHIGIGTAAPTANLDVAGTALFQNAINTASAFQIQNAAGTTLLGVDTSGDQVLLGTAAAKTGILTFNNSTNSNIASITAGATTSSYTLTLPTALPVSNQCLQTNNTGVITFTSCIGSGTATLTNIYGNGTTQADETITLDSTRQGILIKDNASPIGGTLFGVQSNDGTSKYLDVTATGITVAGTVDVSTGYKVAGTAGSGITCSGGQVVQNAVVSGGIVTGGTCTTNGVGATLQTAYDASSSPATITTSSAAKNVIVKAGAGNDSTGIFQIQDSSSNSILNADSVHRFVGINNAAPNATLDVIASTSGFFYGFEPNTLSPFVSSTWSTVSGGAHSGTYSAQGNCVSSGCSGNDQIMTLTKTLSAAGTISFWAKFTASSGCNTNLFYVDATQDIFSTTCTGAYAFYSFPVGSGTHTFEWDVQSRSFSTSSMNVDDVQVTNTGAGGTAALFNGGAVGIGTSFPNTTLDVAGTVHLQSSSNSTAEFQIQTASASDTLFTADTSNNKLVVGNATGTNTATTLLVLDSATADPATGFNGAMYYNTTSNVNRCYVNGAWSNCGANGTTLQNAYDNSSSPATITTSSTTKGILFKAGASNDQSKLFQVQNSTGTDVLDIDTTNRYIGVNTNAPNAALDVNGASANFFDGFETGTLSPFTSASWTVQTPGHTGTYLAQNTLNSTSSIQVIQTLSSAGTISFWWFCSAGDNNDHYFFQIDSNPQVQLDPTFCTASPSGTFSTAVTPGTHTFKWTGSTDGFFTQVFKLDDVNITNAGTATTATFNGGNVGIGTYFPNAGLDVASNALFDASTNSATAFQIQNSGRADTLFSADTSNNKIVIGNSTGTNTATTQLVLDSATSDPTTGYNGAIYYNTNSNSFRCYAGGVWMDCSTNGTGTTLQAAYNNSSTPATITTTSSTKGVVLAAGTGNDNTSLFQVQNAAGGSLFNIDSTNSKITVGQGSLVVTGLGVPTGVNVTAGANTGGSLSGSASTTYYYKVSAINSVGETLASSEASINGASFTPLSSPPAPTGSATTGTNLGVGNYLYELTVVTANGQTTVGAESAVITTTSGNQSVALTLPAIPTGATGYKVYRTVVGGASGTETLITAGGCSGTISTTSCTDSATDAQLSGAPPASNTATTNLNNATVSWTAVPGATSYRIYRGTSSGGESAYQTSASSPFTDTGAAGTTATPQTYDQSARLGVGTSAPTASLDVRGTVNVNGTALFKNAVDSANSFQIQNAAASTILNVASDTTFNFGFETNSLGQFTQAGTGWAVVSSASHTGTYSAFTNTVAGVTPLTLTRSLSIAGTVSFWYRTNAGSTNSAVQFKVDGVTKLNDGSTSSTSFNQVSYALSAGTHVFSWQISGCSGGCPQYYIDDVVVTNTTPGLYVNNGTYAFGTSDSGSGFFDILAPTASSNAVQIQTSLGNTNIVTVSTANNSLTINQGNLTVTNLATPSTPTLTSSASGGTLAAATYLYELAATNANGSTPAVASNPTSVTTSGSTSQNTLSWTPVTNAGGYDIYRSTNGGSSWFKNSVASTSASIVDNGTNFSWGTSATPPSLNTTGGNFTANGTGLFKNASNSTNSFQVQDSAGNSALNVDTTNRFVGINQAAPNATLDVQASSSSFMDGFETGVLSPFTIGGAGWSAVTTAAHSGTWSAFENTLGGINFPLTLVKTLSSPGTISFWYRTDAGSHNNAVQMKIDGVTQLSDSSTSSTSFFKVSYAVAAGTHTFIWTASSCSGSCSNYWIDDVTLTNTGAGTAALFNGGNVGIGTAFPNATLDVAGTSHFQATSGNDSASLFQIQSSTGTNLFTADSINSNISTAANVLASGSVTATTATTSGTGTNTTTVNLVSAAFANNDVIFIDNAGQDFYTRVVSGGGTTALTVSPAVSYDNAAPVTKYNVQNIGATTSDYTTQANRFFQGYFLGGVVTGAGSTIYSDGNIKSVTNMQITAPSMVLQATAGSGTAFQILNGSGKSLFSVDTNNNDIAVGTAGPSGQDGAIVFNNGSNSNTVTLQTGTTLSSYSLLLPTTGPATNQCLVTDSTTANQLTFGSCGTGFTPTTTLQNAYDNSNSPATIVTSSVAKNIIIKAGSGNDSAGIFQIQNSSGQSVLNADSVNRYVGINQATPNATLDVAASSTNFFDGFESGALSPFTTSVSGISAPWTVTTGNVHSGSEAAQGIDTDAAGSTTLSLTRTLSSAGTINFYSAYSNPKTAATWNFKIDGVIQASGSTAFGYTLSSFAVSAGTHTFTWNLVTGGISGNQLNVDDVTVTNAGVGTTALFNGGNVGIGTAFPNQTLDVSGTVHFQASSNNSNEFSVQNVAGNNYLLVDTSGANLYVGNTGIASTIQIGNTTGAVAQTLNFGNNATASSSTTLNIGSTVGASTTNLTAGSGGINLNAATTVNSNVAFTAKGTALFKDATNSTSAFQIQDSSSNPVLDADSINRYIGINNSTPNAALDVQASSSSFFDGFESGLLSPFTASSTNGAPLWTISSGSAHTGTFNASLTDHTTNSTTDMTITKTLNSAGNVSFYAADDTASIASGSSWSFLIDGVTKVSCGFLGCSGAWSNYSYAVSSGSHTFTWRGTGGSTDPNLTVSVDDVTITNAGTATAALINGGNVGIGTFFPSQTLDVKGTSHFQASSDSTSLFQVQNAAGGSLFNADSANSQITVGQGSLVVTGLGVPTGVGVAAGANTGGTLSGAAGTTYYYKVSAINSVGETLASSEASINGQSFTKLSAPAAPTGSATTGSNLGVGNYLYKLTVVTANGETTAGTESAAITTTSGNQSIALTLPAVPTGATGYKVYRTAVGGASGSETLITAGGCSGTISTTSCTDSATDAQLSGASPASNTATTNLNNATVSWTPVAGATSYRIYRGTSSGGESAYQTSATSPFTDNGGAGTATTPLTYDGTSSLGIGTSAPTANLDVRGTVNIAGTALFKNAADSANALQVQNAVGSSVLNVATDTTFTDGFESGTLSPFTTNAGWTASATGSHSGTFNARASGTGTLTLTRTSNAAGLISFWMSYGTGGGGSGSFKIDGVTQISWGAFSSSSYALRSFAVGAGTHTYTWSLTWANSSDVIDVDDVTVTNSGPTLTVGNGSVAFGTTDPGSIYYDIVAPTATTSAFQLQSSLGNGSVVNIDTTSNSLTVNQGNLTVTTLASPLTPTLTSAGTGGTLAAGTYYYQVAATNINGSTPAVASSPASVTTSGSTSQNTLSWSAVANAGGYDVFRSTNGTSWFKNSVSSSTNSIVDNGTNFSWGTSATPPTTNTTGGNLTVNGTATFKNATNSTSAFNVQDASSASALNVDTVDRFVGINNANPQATLDVLASSPNFFDGFETGLLTPFTGTGSWAVSTTNNHSGSFNAAFPAVSNSTGTLTLLRTSSAAGTISFWLKFTTGGGGSGSFAIDGVTKISWGAFSSSSYSLRSFSVSSGAHTYAWTFHWANSSDTIDVDDVTVTNSGAGTTALFNGGNVGIGTSFPNQTLDVSGTTHFQAASGGDSANLFQIQNAAGTSLLNVDSTNSRITSSQTQITLTDGSTPTGLGVVAGANTGGTLFGAAGTTYYYKVTAINANGESLASTEVSINGQSFTKLAAPGAPSGVPAAGTDLGIGTYLYKLTVVTANGETTAGTESATVTTTAGNQDVTLTLPAVPTGATGYHVYRTAVGGASGSETLITAGGCSGTISATSCTDNATDAQISGSPPASNTATTNLNNATVSWTAITGATSYRIYRGTSAGGENAYQTSASSPFTDTGAAGTGASTPTYSAWGALGVGTSTPTANLDIRGTAHFQNAVDGATAFQIQNAAGTSLFTVNTQSNQITLGTASSTPVLLVLGNKNTSGDPTCTDGAIYYNSNTKRFRACTNGAWATFGAFAPGYEISYDQITANASLTATTEGTATTAITSSSFTFDGNTTVLVDVYVPNLNTAGTIGLGLWLDGTEQFGHTWPTDAGGDSGIIEFKVRVTPGSGSHTFTVRGWDSGGTGTVDAGTGTGGASTYPPAYIRISVAN